MSLGSKPAQYGQAPTPADLQPFRGDMTGLLSSLFGNGGSGGAGLSQMFGQLGSPATPLQRQSTGAASAYLNQPAPEQQALDMSKPMLQNIMNSAPGQGIMDALQPQFQQHLAQADQQGGRFGSANAYMRSQSLNDYNLLGAQAAQQGQQTQLQAANALQMLSNQAGQNPFSRIMQAGQLGSADANQADQQNQRTIQLLTFLMGGGQQAAFGQPYVQTKPGQQGFNWGDLLGFLGGNAQTAGAALAGG
jgi:hypothetical protein